MGIELGVTVTKSLINSWYAAFVDLQDTNMPKAMAITTSKTLIQKIIHSKPLTHLSVNGNVSCVPMVNTLIKHKEPNNTDNQKIAMVRGPD